MFLVFDHLLEQFGIPLGRQIEILGYFWAVGRKFWDTFGSF